MEGNEQLLLMAVKELRGWGPETSPARMVAEFCGARAAASACPVHGQLPYSKPGPRVSGGYRLSRGAVTRTPRRTCASMLGMRLRLSTSKKRMCMVACQARMAGR